MSQPAEVSVLAMAEPLLSAPGEDAAWQAAFRNLLERLSCEFAGLMGRPAPNETSKAPLALLAGMDAKQADICVREFHAIDPFQRPRAAGALRTAGTPLFSEEVVPTQELLDSAFYNQYLRQWGPLQHGISAIIAGRDGSELHMGLMRHRGAPFDAAERRICDLFLRLASPALAQRNLIKRLEEERAAGLGVFESSGDGLFVLDAERRLQTLNAAGQGWLEREAVVFLQGGRLQFRHVADTDWLRRECQALLPERPGPVADYLRYRRIDCGGHEARLFAVLSRLPTLPSLSGYRPPPRAVLYLRCVEESIPQLGDRDLEQLFGLTPTEVRVTNALLLGFTVEQMAQLWGIRGDTVRAHLKRLLAKTGCARQSQLVQMLSKALPHLALMNGYHEPEC
jgi:DNA-binding CsgD family transcriptional regulator/PAS domain-containing protein